MKTCIFFILVVIFIYFNHTFGQANNQRFQAMGSPILGPGDWNTAGGSNSLSTNDIGQFNTAIGGQALNKNTSGSNNTAVGLNSLYTNSTAVDNTAVGFQSLYYNIASFNTAIGSSALQANNNGSNNTAIGYQSLFNNLNATDNTAIGYQSLLNNNGANAKNANTIALPAISANQIASNGSNVVVVVPATAQVTGAAATPEAATGQTFDMYTISAAGVPTGCCG